MDKVVSYVMRDMIHHPGYPASIIFPHCMHVAWTFRRFRGDDLSERSIFYQLIAPWFMYGFGGTVLRDLALGRPPSFVASKDIHKYYITALLLMNMSPGDMVYKMMQTRMHPLRLTCQAVESIDAVTTLCSSFEKAKIACPNSPYAPFTLTLLTALGGSIFRYLDRRGRLRSSYDVKTEWSKPTGTIERAVGLIVMYAFMRRIRGQRFARSFVVFLFVFLKLYVVYSVQPTPNQNKISHSKHT